MWQALSPRLTSPFPWMALFLSPLDPSPSLLSSPQGWVQLHRLHLLYLRNLALRAVVLWRGLTLFTLGIRRRVAGLRAAWRLRRLGQALRGWGREAAHRQRLAGTQAAVVEAHR